MGELGHSYLRRALPVPALAAFATKLPKADVRPKDASEHGRTSIFVIYATPARVPHFVKDGDPEIIYSDDDFGINDVITEPLITGFHGRTSHGAPTFARAPGVLRNGKSGRTKPGSGQAK